MFCIEIIRFETILQKNSYKEIVIIKKKLKSWARACLMIAEKWFRKPRKRNGWRV